MKKTILAALTAASMISGAAVASENPTATLVFEGYISSVTPSTDWTVTGVGGVGTPGKGTLAISTTGEVTTSVPVLFEVRAFDDTTGKAGDLAAEYKVRYVSSALTAGSAVVDATANEVDLNDLYTVEDKWAVGTLSDKITATQSKVEFQNLAGFDISTVGAGEAVQSSVVIMIEEASATATGA